MFEDIIDPAWDLAMIPFGWINDNVLGAVGYSCGFIPPTAAAMRRPMGVPTRGGVPARGVAPVRRSVPPTTIRTPQAVGRPPVSRGATVPRTGFVRYMRG